MMNLADISGKAALRGLPVVITHLKPGEGEMIMREINEGALRWGPKMLQHQQVFEF